MARRQATVNRRNREGGKLRIGDQWNAITIIALSQNNPLKAIAELVENAIDARATEIQIVRGRSEGEPYLRVVDNGEGIRLNDEGQPDFAFVATHICDSIKRTLKRKGAEGLQGEFGIGLLSFWTVGERLLMASPGTDGATYYMEMRKGEQTYEVRRRRLLLAQTGCELLIKPLLPGIRALSAERIQRFLASELRDRIRKSGARITLRDRRSRKELAVVPREFTGRLLHSLGPVSTSLGTVEVELYVNPADGGNRVALHRGGTRVLGDLCALPGLDHSPWNSGFLQGLVDAPFLQLTPGTRDGVVADDRYAELRTALAELEPQVNALIEQERAAEEEEAIRSELRSVQRALTQGFLALPPDDYDWLEVPAARGSGAAGPAGPASSKGPTAAGDGAAAGAGAGEGAAATADGQGALVVEALGGGSPDGGAEDGQERPFHEFAGPLFKVVTTPRTAVVAVGATCTLRALPRDRSGRLIDHGVEVSWSIVDGEGELRDAGQEAVTFVAPAEPGLTELRVAARQADFECAAEATITIAESIGKRETASPRGNGRGIPAYTFHNAPGELWRSRFDEARNLLVINNGHSDYRYAARQRQRKLRYILRVYAKELVLHNFPGIDRDELLERMIELSLYTEEHLR